MQTNFQKYLFCLFLICTSVVPTFAQQKKITPVKDEGIVTYSFRNNGKDMKEAPALELVFKKNVARLMEAGRPQKNERQYFDFNQRLTYQVLTQKNGQKVTLKTPFPLMKKQPLPVIRLPFLVMPAKKQK